MIDSNRKSEDDLERADTDLKTEPRVVEPNYLLASIEKTVLDTEKVEAPGRINDKDSDMVSAVSSVTGPYNKRALTLQTE